MLVIYGLHQSRQLGNEAGLGEAVPFRIDNIVAIKMDKIDSGKGFLYKRPLPAVACNYGNVPPAQYRADNGHTAGGMAQSPVERGY